MQGALDKLGYSLGPCGVDGVYGRATKKAVAAFQKDKGLTVDGIAGSKTIAEIELGV
jgi:N-acetylmuramoyl-L-alanine amidase